MLPPPLLLLLLLGVHTAQSSQLDISADSVTAGVREVVLDNGAPTPHGGPPLRPVTEEDERPIVVVPAGRPAIVPAASVTTPLAGGDAQDTDITADEEDEDEEDQPLRLRPLGELPTRVPLGELPIQPAPPPLPVDFPVWVPPQAAAASGPLREFLQPALNVSQDFETAERTGYTIRVSTATDLLAATDAFIADATASGHALFAGARAAILLALQQSAVDVMRSQSQPPLTAAQWVEAVALERDAKETTPTPTLTAAAFVVLALGVKELVGVPGHVQQAEQQARVLVRDATLGQPPGMPTE